MKKNEFDVPVDWGKLSSHKPSKHAKSEKQIYWSRIRKARKAEDRVWSLGLGPMCCLHHHCPMTVYGGCSECNKKLLDRMEEAE